MTSAVIMEQRADGELKHGDVSRHSNVSALL